MRTLNEWIMRHKNNCEVIKRAEKTSTDETTDEKWLYENRIRLLKIGRDVYKELCAAKKTVKRGQKMRIFDICGELLNDRAYSFGERELIEYLRSYQEKNDYFTIFELCFLKAAFVVLCLDKIAKEAKKQSAVTEGEGVIGLAVSMLYRLYDIDFENVLCEVSRTEEVLRSDPDGTYNLCDGDTKSMYRRKISEICRRDGVDEYNTAVKYKKLAEQTKGGGGHIGYYIMKESARDGGWWYFPLICTLPLFLVVPAAIAAFAIESVMLLLASLLSYFPLRLLIKSILADLVAISTVPDILPRLAVEKIPSAGKTMAVYTVVLTNADKDKSLFDKISNYARAYKDKNLTIALLADLPDSDEEFSSGDDDIIEYAKKRIDEINRTDAEAFLFIRRRSYSKSERKYIGHERKRGAQEELFSLLAGGKSSLTVYGKGELSGYKYVLTLDYDTEIMYSDIKNLIGTALHPYNRPEYSVDGTVTRVTSGYGVIQPTAVLSLESSDKWNRYNDYKNAFEGRSSYESAVFSLYQKLFGIGTYCGKGLICVEAYNRVIKGMFPRETILSHDIPEGLRLRCGFASDIEIYDSPPTSYLSEMKRRHRWMRGDVQSLSLAKRFVKDKTGDNYRNPLSIKERMMLSDPVYAIITDVIRVPAIILALVSGNVLGILIFASLISDHIYDSIKRIVSAVRVPQRHYLSRVPDYYEAAVFTSLFLVFSAAQACAVSFDALVRAFYRMKISRRRLLEWAVFDPSGAESSKTLLFYHKKLKASVVIGVLSIMASVVSFDFLSVILLLNGVLWCAFPYLMYRLNNVTVKSTDSTPKNTEELRADVSRMWQFFSRYVNDEYHHLPPDNVMLMPEYKIAERTSPTNIGMYLISLVNAFDFGLIGSDELYYRLSKTVDTIEKLEKWHGHLYNWYDIKTCRVLYPAYVSTVDSGNLIVSLITVKNAVISHGVLFDALVKQLDRIISDADFSKLYNKRRDLFYIGYNGMTGEYDRNVYDLYASEMLTTSYYAIASGQVPASHFSSLGRLFSDSKSHSVMLSWSGSAFEYFMPTIFLPTRDKTERGEMLLSARHSQREKYVDFHGLSLYGTSESAFYDFDDGMNYSYKAHGVKSLAMARDTGRESVYSPYALYLMSAYDKDIPNLLSALSETDLFGKYGLYDSVDMTPSRVGRGYGIARLYMSHHLGMSISSVANFCLDGINVKRFMSEPTLRSAQPLLLNKIEICRTAADDDISYIEPEHIPSSIGEGVITKQGAAVVSNGRERIVADDEGHVTLYSGTKLITQMPSRGMNGFHVLIRADGDVYDCFCGRSSGNGIKSSFYYDGGSVVYVNEIIHGEHLMSTELSMSVDSISSLISVKLRVVGTADKLDVLFFLLPVIDGEAHYESSPSYSDLFLSAEIAADGSIIYRRRADSKQDSFMKVGFVGEREPRSVFTRSDDVLDFGCDKASLRRIFDAEGHGVSGPCVHPLYASVFKENASKEFAVEMQISIDDGESANKTYEDIHSAATTQFALTASLSGADASVVKTAANMLSMISDKRRRVTVMKEACELKYRRDIFWRYGVSGDLPIITVFVGETEKSSTEFAVRELLRAKRFLFISGIRLDLLLIADDSGYYGSELGGIRRLAERNGCGALIGKNNGIFLIGKSHLSENDEKIIVSCSGGVIDISASHGFGFEKPAANKILSARKPSRNAKNEFSLTESGIVISNGSSPSPWTMVYANPSFGTLLTNRSCGFTWYRNSSLSTVSARHRDPIIGNAGETLELIVDGKYYDLVAEAEKTIYERGSAVYSGMIDEIEYKVRVGVDPKLPFKLYHLSVSGYSDEQKLSAVLTVYPPCHAVASDDCLRLMSEDGLIIKLFSAHGGRHEEFISHSDCVSLSSDLVGGMCGFVMAAFPEASYIDLVSFAKNKYRTPEAIISSFDEYAREQSEWLHEVFYRGGREWLLPMVNLSLYQAVYYRMIAKCGYSQPGGAFGFRDQLQDSLAALYFKPELTKKQILRSCERQYTDGRVQHWWHEDVGGLKSRCSDDYMWLPYVTAEYIFATGDYDILSLDESCLFSPPLSDGEEDRYEKAEATSEKYSVLEHCLMAVRASSERGAHGLPLMLSGDWNDGMNGVGKNGKGESVWLAFFFAVTYRKLGEVLKDYKDETRKLSDKLFSMADELVNAAESAWDGEWYLRAYDDDGEKLGSIESDECKLDIIPQAFSVFANADSERTVFAMESVYRELYDDGMGILRLFAPSFSKTRKYGYICRYPAGIRENGGQYTHAAIWAAIAFFELGAWGRGMEIIEALTPLQIYSRGAMDGRYTAEPYLLCADIYHGKNITGKSGWSGYTGSAAWYYRTVMMYLLGVRLIFGNIKLTPPPESVNGDYSFSFSYNDCLISVDVTYSGKVEDEKSYDRIAILSSGESVNVAPDGKSLKILLKVRK